MTIAQGLALVRRGTFLPRSRFSRLGGGWDMKPRAHLLMVLLATIAASLAITLPTTWAHDSPGHHGGPHPSPSLRPQDPTETVFSTNASNDLLPRLDFRTGKAAVVNSLVDDIVR